MSIHKKIVLLIFCIVTSPIHSKDDEDLSAQVIKALLLGAYTAIGCKIISHYLGPSQAELEKLKIAHNTALHAKEKAYIELPVTLLDREGNNLKLKKEIGELELASKEYTIKVHNYNRQSIQSIRTLLEECQEEYPHDKKKCEHIKKLLDETISLATEFTIECKKEITRD